jgi:Fic family protein
MQQYPVFEYLPIESLIKENQTEYYKALGQSDKLGSSTPFIEFMLSIILQTLENLLKTQNRTLNTETRIAFFKDIVSSNEFCRKDYLQAYKEVSQATASRDLKWAVDQDILIKTGDKRLTKYRYKL